MTGFEQGRGVTFPSVPVALPYIPIVPIAVAVSFTEIYPDEPVRLPELSGVATP